MRRLFVPRSRIGEQKVHQTDEVEIVLPFPNNENVFGGFLTEQAKRLEAFSGVAVVDAILKIQSDIPQSWRGYNMAVPGVDSYDQKQIIGDALFLRYDWCEHKWRAHPGWLESDFSLNTRFLRYSPRGRAAIICFE